MKLFVHSLTAKGLLFIILVLFFSCKKENKEPVQKEDNASALLPSAANKLKAGGAMQISGVGFLAATDECGPLIDGAAFALKMTGDLEGCLYVFIDDFECSPSGTYREEGREYFVGTYNGKTGTFWTTYKFEAKYEGCSANGTPLGAEIFGRCQHPIVNGSATGGFEGVTGQLNFKDEIESGNYPYRGHLQF